MTRLPSTLGLLNKRPCANSPAQAIGQASWCPRCPRGKKGQWQKSWGLKREGMEVSWGCRDNAPQTGLLKTTGIYFLTVLEATSPKSRRQQDSRPLNPVREGPPVPSPASGGGGQSLTCGCISQSHGHFLSVCLSVLFLERQQTWGQGPPCSSVTAS